MFILEGTFNLSFTFIVQGKLIMEGRFIIQGKLITDGTFTMKGKIIIEVTFIIEGTVITYGPKKINVIPLRKLNLSLAWNVFYIGNTCRQQVARGQTS